MSQPVQQRVNKATPDAASEQKKGNLPVAIRPFLFAPASIHLGLLALVLIYLGLALAFSQIISFNKGPDEGYHLEYITFLKEKGRLPITYEERAQITRADFPPLYQLIVAGLSAGVSIEGPPTLKIFWDSFRYQALDLQTDQAWTIKTEDYQWPYVGRFLVWQIGRWFSIWLSLATVVITFFALQETPLGRNRWAALAGAAFLAFIPQYIFLGSSLNDDNLLGLLGALYFWLLLKVLKQPERWRLFIGLGILLGLTMTVKYTFIVGLVEVVGLCLILARRERRGWRWAWARIGVVSGLMVLGSSWWFGWNIWFLNTVKTDGWLVGLLKPVLAGGNDVTLNRISGFFSGGQIGLATLPENTRIGTFSDWVRVTFLSFWGVGIGETMPLYPYAYLVAGLMMGMAVLGLWQLWRKDSSTHQWLLLLTFHVAIFFILPLIRFGLSRRLGQTAQGRHILIPAAAAIAGLLIWGLVTVIPPRVQRWVFLLLLAGLVSWTGLHLYQLATLTPPPLPLRTLPQAAEWLPYPVNAQFDDKVELVSYDIDPQPEHGLLRLDLAWRSLAPSNESYLVKVTLVNTTGQVVSHWLGYNGRGRAPTLAWDPGDVVFDRLALPLAQLPVGSYTLQIQLLSSTGPVALSSHDNQAAADNTLRLTEIQLSRPATLSFSRHLNVGSRDVAFALWRSNGPIETPAASISASPLPDYRYPASISILVAESKVDEAELDLQLVDATGQAWPVTRNEAHIYTFIISPRWPSGAYQLQMTLKKDGQVINQAVSEPLLTVTNWWERHFVAPEIAVPYEANFANQLKFLGYKLPKNRVKAGEAFPLTLYWQALPDKAPQVDFIQFNNFLDSSGALYGGYDRRPLEYYSTLLWTPGEVIVDGYAVPVEATAPPGQYYLNVGYYLTVGESAVNLPLVIDGQMSEMSSITIGPIEVAP